MMLKERFDQYEHEFLEDHRLTNRRHARKDIHAFLLLHDIDPRPRDIVAAAEHDEIWFDTDIEKFEPVVTDEQIRELVWCGVFYDEETESLGMFV